MARTHGRIFSTIWDDAEWRSLSLPAQWLYEMLISQKKLRLAGSIDYKPGRWAALCSGITRVDVERAAEELEAARFIVIDHETDELVIRTFVRHDSGFARNSKLLKGVWSAWSEIESPTLRQVVVDNVPDEVWSSDRATPPAEAQRMRDSPPPDPPVPTNGTNRQSELVVPTGDSDPSGRPLAAVDGGEGAARGVLAGVDTNPQVSTDRTTRSNYQIEPPDRTVLTPDPCPLTPDKGSRSATSKPNPQTELADPVSSSAQPVTAPPLALVVSALEPPPADPDVVIPQTMWDQFWADWPRKQHKQQAKQAWRAVGGVGAAGTDIVAGLRHWLAHWDADATPEKFIPYPERWLRERRWLEAPPALTSQRSAKATANERSRANVVEAYARAVGDTGGPP